VTTRRRSVRFFRLGAANLYTAAATAIALAFFGSSARAEPAPPPSDVTPTEHETAAPPGSDNRSADPGRVAGVERDPVVAGDNARNAGAALLFPFRELFAGLFWTADSLGELARKAKFVSRMDHLLFPKPGEIALVPTLFFQSRHPPSFGARIVTAGTRGDTAISAASGGPNDVFVAAAVDWKLPALRSTLAVDALYDERNRIELRGIGQDPDTDPRDRFRPTAIAHDAYYLEERSRVVAALDVTIAKPVHAIASTSLLLSRVRDAIGADGQALSKVFEPTPPFAGAAMTRVVYSELALRAGTRKRWDGADPGAQAELYGGYGAGVDGTDARYVGAGGRLVAFIPIFKPVNTLSPKIVIDTVTPLGNALPFTLLAEQPDFRGYDIRRDRDSLVISLDYRWVVMRYLATSVFVDAATLAPALGELFTTVPRFAAGFGFDVFDARSDIARFAVAGSGDGIRVLVSLGYSLASGDRQHRN
jgi:hypothetical protein